MVTIAKNPDGTLDVYFAGFGHHTRQHLSGVPINAALLDFARAYVHLCAIYEEASPLNGDQGLDMLRRAKELIAQGEVK